MALLPDPTTAASERQPVKKNVRKDSAGIYMSLPQCIEGCPQHESTHKTRVRHKQRRRSRTVSKTSLRGVEAGSRRMHVQESLGKDVHNMKACSL